MPPDLQWRKRKKKEIIKNMKRQVFFIYLILEWLFYFAFEKTSYALPKRLQHRCFPVNIAKCLTTDFYIEHLLIILFQSFM